MFASAREQQKHLDRKGGTLAYDALVTSRFSCLLRPNRMSSPKPSCHLLTLKVAWPQPSQNRRRQFHANVPQNVRQNAPA